MPPRRQPRLRWRCLRRRLPRQMCQRKLLRPCKHPLPHRCPVRRRKSYHPEGSCAGLDATQRCRPALGWATQAQPDSSHNLPTSLSSAAVFIPGAGAGQHLCHLQRRQLGTLRQSSRMAWSNATRLHQPARLELQPERGFGKSGASSRRSGSAFGWARPGDTADVQLHPFRAGRHSIPMGRGGLCVNGRGARDVAAELLP